MIADFLRKNIGIGFVLVGGVGLYWAVTRFTSGEGQICTWWWPFSSYEVITIAAGVLALGCLVIGAPKAKAAFMADRGGFVLRFAVGVLLLAVLEFGIFTFWWIRSPRRVEYVEGTKVTMVDFHMTPFRWQTASLWVPAFYVVPRVSGYTYVGLIPAADDAVYYFGREEHPTR